jgi:hypothetical protein
VSTKCPTCQTPLEIVAALRFNPAEAWETRATSDEEKVTTNES